MTQDDRSATPAGVAETRKSRNHDVSPEVVEAYRRVLSDQDGVDAVAQLANVLARSGSTRGLERRSADIASTGGPSSLSTLLCPLYLVGMGFEVPKIGVPGRPAGGIDVLGSLRGFRTTLSVEEFNKVLADAGYAHILADATWAPEDAALFRLRQQQGTQAVPALAVASLLAKKIAAGVGIAGLEARIAPYGNFGASVDEGRRSATLYCRVAAELGLEPVVILTDARVPYQPYIGRGEALTALWKVVTHDVDDDPWLAEHAAMCLAMARAVAGRTSLTTSHSGSVGPTPIQALSANLDAQGASIDELVRHSEETSSHAVQTVVAGADGFARYRLERIRAVIGELGGADKQRVSEHGDAVFTDLAGVRLLSPPGRRVRRGEPVIELRSQSGCPPRLTAGLFDMTDSPGPVPNTILEVISS